MDKINLAPARLALDASNLWTLTQMFIAAKCKTTKQATGPGYEHKLRWFSEWWQATGPTCAWVLTADCLVEFNNYLDTCVSAYSGEPLAYHTRKDVLRRLKGFFSWSIHHGYITDPRWLTSVPKPHGAARIHNAVTLATVRAIYRGCVTGSFPARDCALLAVLAGTGMRRAECASLAYKDVQFVKENGQPAGGYITVRQAKMDKPRTVAFDNATGKFLKQYMQILPDRDGSLFISHRDEPINVTGIYKAILRAAARGGAKEEVAVHDLRRTYATFWARKLPGEGYGALLAKQLGHTLAPGMTFGLYTKYDANDIRKCLLEHRCSLFAQMLDSVAANTGKKGDEVTR